MNVKKFKQTGCKQEIIDVLQVWHNELRRLCQTWTGSISCAALSQHFVSPAGILKESISQGVSFFDCRDIIQDMERTLLQANDQCIAKKVDKNKGNASWKTCVGNILQSDRLWLPEPPVQFINIDTVAAADNLDTRLEEAEAVGVVFPERTCENLGWRLSHPECFGIDKTGSPIVLIGVASFVRKLVRILNEMTTQAQPGKYQFPDGTWIARDCTAPAFDSELTSVAEAAADADPENQDLADAANEATAAIPEEFVCTTFTDAIRDSGLSIIDLDPAIVSSDELVVALNELLATEGFTSAVTPDDMNLALGALTIFDQHISISQLKLTRNTQARNIQERSVLRVGLTGDELGAPGSPGKFEGITLPSNHPARVLPALRNQGDVCLGVPLEKARLESLISSYDLQNCERTLPRVSAFLFALQARLKGMTVSISGRLIPDFGLPAELDVGQRFDCQQVVDALRKAEARLLPFCITKGGITEKTGLSPTEADLTMPIELISLKGDKSTTLPLEDKESENTQSVILPANRPIVPVVDLSELENKRRAFARQMLSKISTYLDLVTGGKSDNPVCGQEIGNASKGVFDAVMAVDITGFTDEAIMLGVIQNAANIEIFLRFAAIATIRPCFPCNNNRDINIDVTMQDPRRLCSGAPILVIRSVGSISEVIFPQYQQFQNVSIPAIEIPAVREQFETMKEDLLQQARLAITERCGLESKSEQFVEKLNTIQAAIDSELDSCILSLVGQQIEDSDQFISAMQQCAQSSLTMSLDESLADCV